VEEDKVILFYVPTSSVDEAKKIARELLEKRLCACVNIYPEVYSLYWWEDKIEEGTEAVMIIKTRKSLADEVEETISSLHTYTCPSIIRLGEITEANKCFIDWILRETKPAK